MTWLIVIFAAWILLAVLLAPVIGRWIRSGKEDDR